MATTLQNIVETLQGSGLLPTAQIQAGLTDGLQPPYLAVLEYEHSPRYDTCAHGKTPAYCILDSTFKILIIHKGADAAETLASSVDEFVNMNLSLTPNTKAVFQTGYKSSQMAEQLYQWGVEITYRLHESF